MQLKKTFIDDILGHFTPEQAIAVLKADHKAQPVESRINLQVLYNALGREEEAFEVSSQLFRLAPQDPRIIFNRGWHLLKRGDLLQGLYFLEAGRQMKAYGNPPLASRLPLWTSSSGQGHRMHLLLEGGFGDEVIHLRFAKTLVENHNCKVTVICSPGLADLIARCPWVSAVAQREAAPGIYHQSWLPGMSAALALGLNYEDIPTEPYLMACPTRQEHWRKILNSSGKKLKVALRWSGNPNFEHQQLRKFPSDVILNLVRSFGSGASESLQNDVQFFSVQRDNDLISLPEEVMDLGPHLKDWDDTAAVLSQMDLVITSCTSIAHVSAALGKPTWVVIPALAYFVWARPGRSSPWYDTVRLFRQSQYGTWEDVKLLLKREFLDWKNSSVI